MTTDKEELKRAVQMAKLEDLVNNLGVRIEKVEAKLDIIEQSQESNYKESTKTTAEIMRILNDLNNKVDGRLSKLEFADQLIQKEVVEQKRRLDLIDIEIARHGKLLSTISFFIEHWRIIAIGPLLLLLASIAGVFLQFQELFKK